MQQSKKRHRKNLMRSMRQSRLSGKLAYLKMRMMRPQRKFKFQSRPQSRLQSQSKLPSSSLQWRSDHRHPYQVRIIQRKRPSVQSSTKSKLKLRQRKKKPPQNSNRVHMQMRISCIGTQPNSCLSRSISFLCLRKRYRSSKPAFLTILPSAMARTSSIRLRWSILLK